MELSSTSEHGGCSGQTLPSFYVFSVTSVRGEGAQESLSSTERESWFGTWEKETHVLCD